MSGPKSRIKFILIPVALFILTFLVSLVVLAYDYTPFVYWRVDNPSKKLCDGTIAANLPVARYNGANEWQLKSEHWLSIQSYEVDFDYTYGWAHGWCLPSCEGDWNDCDQFDNKSGSLGPNSSASHSRYNWWYDEYADEDVYKAVAAGYFKPEGRNYTNVDDSIDITR